MPPEPSNAEWNEENLAGRYRESKRHRDVNSQAASSVRKWSAACANLRRDGSSKTQNEQARLGVPFPTPLSVIARSRLAARG